MIEEHYDFLKFSETLSTWPEKVTQRLEMAFFLFSNEYGTMGQHFQVDSGSAIKFGLLTNVELEFALFTWRSLDYLNLDADSYHFITPKGWEYLESITAAAAKIKRLKQVFVAMSFNPEHEDIYNLAIEPAIRKCEFTPILIKYKEFNDGIMDNVISEIRKSRFVIADYTGNKRGVYYEAGFAYGLGLSVIKCVKEDHLKPDIVAEDKLHFDVQHLNFIVWNDYEVLKNRIINRIQALSL